MARVRVLLSYWVALWLLCCFSGMRTEVEDIGVNYGLLGDNLPSPDRVIALCIARGIKRLRLFNPNAAVLKALDGSGIEVILGTLNEDLQKLGADPSYASAWVQTNVIPHARSVAFRYICAGNEVIPGSLAAYVLPAMLNLDHALRAANASVPVTTAVAGVVLGASYPPSQGSFSAAAAPVMAPIASFLQAKRAPLLVNVYPYFAYVGNPKDVSLDYALFTSPGVVVEDGALGYTNLFDAMVDAMHSALEQAGGSDVGVVVSETGWPSGGGMAATTENAMKYNNNLLAHVRAGGGTPKRPGKRLETYLFAVFNENQKPTGIERNFGMYQPDMTEVYHVYFAS